MAFAMDLFSYGNISLISERLAGAPIAENMPKATLNCTRELKDAVCDVRTLDKLHRRHAPDKSCTLFTLSVKIPARILHIANGNR